MGWRRITGRATWIVVAALLGAGCGAAAPELSDPAADDPAAVAQLVAAAGEVCAGTGAARAASTDLTEQAVLSFDEVRLLGAVQVPDALRGGAHETWWQRYLAVRRATLLEVLDVAAEGLLASQAQDPPAWRRAARLFEEPLASLEERDRRELAAMRAGARAGAEVTGTGSTVLGEVERRLADALGLTACNRSVLDGDLATQARDAEELARLEALAGVLAGELG